MQTAIAYSPEQITAMLLAADRRVLLFGESGVGKSTLAAGLAMQLAESGRTCNCIGADPGSPAFGVPGAVCLGRWRADEWRVIGLEPLCTLDGGRFRLPLTAAVRRLAAQLEHGTVLIDAPGVMRGIAGAELLVGLAEAGAVDLILVVAAAAARLPVANELAVIGCEVCLVQPSGDAHLPTRRQRANRRTRLWDHYLAGAGTRNLCFAETMLTGTPPPLAAPEAWQGRQIALLKGGRMLAMGEIVNLRQNIVQVRTMALQEEPDQLLVRDAGRDGRGRLATCKPVGLGRWRSMPPDVAPYACPEENIADLPVIRLGDATAVLMNGVMGDPLLHLRLHNRKRSLLFDLGEGGRLPARLAHQVTDVFISHAHIDHICGFLWLMRSRIGLMRPCRIFGPPGTADRIAGLINVVHWDRIGDAGPRFEVGELHEGQLLVYALQAGGTRTIQGGSRPAPGGLLLDDPDCRVNAVALTHCSIPVLAYCLELATKFNVRKDRLRGLGMNPGPWLGELKKRLAAGEHQAAIRLPNGAQETAGRLADGLIQVTPSRKVVYATDLSNTAANLAALRELAQGSHIMFCEAGFLGADEAYAEKSGHLTGPACGKLARSAAVEQLVPFHFSRRYEKRVQEMYDEVRGTCGKVRLLEF